MTNEITPPPELVQQWLENGPEDGEFGISRHIATQASRWGADTELEACCEWFVRDWTDIETADKLRAFRRPKPPSLKEQALEALDSCSCDEADSWKLIRRALEQLDD